MSGDGALDLTRFLTTLAVVGREAGHLVYSRQRVFEQRVDADWVQGLIEAPPRLTGLRPQARLREAFE